MKGLPKIPIPDSCCDSVKNVKTLKITIEVSEEQYAFITRVLPFAPGVYDAGEGSQVHEQLVELSIDILKQILKNRR